MKLITHSGAFHADEVLSTAILRDLFDDHEIIRTRDPDIISPGAGKIVYDVGGRYSPELMCFDHHQPGSPVREADKSPYSSFGLIWKHFGVDWLKKAGLAEGVEDRVHLAMDRSFVKEVDVLDNGADVPGRNSPLNFSRMIELFAPDFDDKEISIEEKFHEALEVASIFFNNAVRNVSARIRATMIVEAEITKSGDDEILTLPYGMPWEGAVKKMKAEHIKMVLIPRDGNWSVNTVRKSLGGTERRVDLPEEWAGLAGDELAQVSGIEDAIFVHKARFFASAKSYEGARKMAELSIEAQERPEENPTL